MVRLQQGVDAMGNMIISAIPQSDTIYTSVMVANTAQYITPPAGANFVLFQATTGLDFWALLYPTTTSSGLTIPATVTELADAYTIPELNPLIRALSGPGYMSAKTIGIIALSTPTICMAFYA